MGKAHAINGHIVILALCLWGLLCGDEGSHRCMMLTQIILVALFITLALPLALYVGSLDWSRKHTKKVTSLPEFSAKADSGQYRLAANGLEFVLRVAGMQNTGQNLILLHGFPESSLMWQALLTQAAQAGYRVVAFDQRGYSPMARPKNVSDYQLAALSADVLAVADGVGFERFHLVGHDWGAVVGWLTVMNNSQRVQTWTALSIPHIGTFFDAVINDPEQAKRSRYFSFFQRPYLPEFLLTIAGQRNLKKLLAALPQSHKEEYFAILAEPGALTAQLNWYRAMDVLAYAQQKTFERDIYCPTLFIWGRNDGIIAESVIAKQTRFIKAAYKGLAFDTGHNLMQSKENQVIAAILEHIPS